MPPVPSPQTDTLTRAFRASEIAASAAAASLVRDAWNITVKPGDIQGTATKWLVLATAIIVRYRAQSAAAGAIYYTLMRGLEIPDAPKFDVPKPSLMEIKFLQSSLWAMGPAQLLKAKEQISPDEKDPNFPIKLAMVGTSKALEATTIRHVQNGGRNTIDQARNADPVAVGYYRETDGDPCYFCAMLASRLGVYKEDSFDQSDARFEGEGKAKVHDQCACHNRPLFSRQDDSVFPQSSRDAARMWNELPLEYKGRPASGANAVRAFRHLYNESRKGKS